jgi:hypothetical protein
MKYDALVENEIDAIDAAVFSGDLFMNEVNREDFRRWLNRWKDRLMEYEDIDLSMLQSKFKVGDKVKVYRKYDDCEFWTYKMDCCIGQEFIISEIDLDDNSVKFEGEVWWFPIQSLTLISKDI